MWFRRIVGEKTKWPPHFALQRKNFWCSKADLSFQFLGFLAVVRNFFAAAATICPPNAEYMYCSGKESRFNNYDLSYPLLSSPAAVPNFLTAAVVHGFASKNFKLFIYWFIYMYIYIYYLYGQTPLQHQISTLQWRTITLFLFGFLAVVRQNFTVVASFFLSCCLMSLARHGQWGLMQPFSPPRHSNASPFDHSHEKSSSPSSFISIAPKGRTFSIVNGPDHLDLSFPRSTINLQLKRKTF